jgi:hypothetical protein
MLEIGKSGSMSGKWKRSMVKLLRHRQTKEPATDSGTCVTGDTANSATKRE